MPPYTLYEKKIEKSFFFDTENAYQIFFSNNSDTFRSKSWYPVAKTLILV